MKKYTFYILVLLTNSFLFAQTPQLIEASSTGFGEIFIEGSTLIRSGVEQEAAKIQIDNPDFPVEIVASGPLNTDLFLRSTLNEDASIMYLSDIDGQLWQAPLNTGSVVAFTTLGDFPVEMVALDYYNNRVYFTTPAPQILSFNPLDPNNTLEEVYDPPNSLPIFNTQIIEDFLYYSTQSSFNPPVDYEVYRLNLTIPFPIPELVAQTPDRIFTLTGFGDFLYVGSDITNAVHRIDILGNFPAVPQLVYNQIIPTSNSSLASIVHGGDFIYFSTDNGVYRVQDPFLDVTENFKDNISVFPNPTVGDLFISYNNDIEKIYLSDINGKKLGEYITSEDIDLHKYQNGIYFLKLLFIDGSSIVKKVVVQK